MLQAIVGDVCIRKALEHSMKLAKLTQMKEFINMIMNMMTYSNKSNASVGIRPQLCE